MREYYFGNGLTLTYCDRDIWLRDGNSVKLESSQQSGKVGAIVTITNMATGESKTLNHNSELPSLVFPIRDCLQYLHGNDPNEGRSYNISVRAWNNGTYSGDYSWRHEMGDGVSLPFRSHGSVRTIYLYGESDLVKVGLYANAPGRYTFGGYSTNLADGFVSVSFTGVISSGGEYLMGFSTETVPPSVVIAGVVSENPWSGDAVLEFSENTQPADDRIIGTEWEDSSFSVEENTIRIIYDPVDCKRANTMKFRYLDIDGNTRYIMGSVMQTSIESDGTAYRRIEPSVYANISRRVINTETATVTVIFEDIRRDAYLDEIQLSSTVEYLNWADEWIPCTLATAKLVTDRNETQDWKMEFRLSSDEIK